jgi:hypothetical protein
VNGKMIYLMALVFLSIIIKIVMRGYFVMGVKMDLGFIRSIMVINIRGIG